MAALFSRASAHARSSACGCAYSHFPAALPARVLPSVSTHGVSGNSARSSTFLIPYFRGQRRQFSTGPTDGTQLTVPLGNEDEQRDVSAARNNGDIPGAVHGGDKMMIIYTCTVCDVRSARVITKLAYYNGVVLVRCPGCNNLHLVADRLGYFEDNSSDIEAIAREKGEVVKKGTLGGGSRGGGGPSAGSQALGSVMSGGAAHAPGSTASPAAAAGGPVDQYVIELTADDLAVLSSRGKSVNLRTGAEVVDKLEYRDKATSTVATGAPSAPSKTAAQGDGQHGSGAAGEKGSGPLR